jgi:cytochrome c-type biogenesis protein CcmH/NrfG
MKNVLARHAFTAADWFQLGRSLMGEGRLPQAGLCFQAAVHRDHTHAEAWFCLAQSQENLGLFEQASVSLVCSLSLKPDHYEARMKLVQMLINQGNNRQAFQVWWGGRKLKRGG